MFYILLYYYQGGDSMRAHPQSSDTAYTFLTGSLQSRAKEPEINYFCKEDALTSSFNILNALEQLVLVMSVFHVECDSDSGYLVHPAL